MFIEYMYVFEKFYSFLSNLSIKFFNCFIDPIEMSFSCSTIFSDKMLILSAYLSISNRASSNDMAGTFISMTSYRSLKLLFWNLPKINFLKSLIP